jgi:hypothetical protein
VYLIEKIKLVKKKFECRLDNPLLIEEIN